MSGINAEYMGTIDFQQPIVSTSKIIMKVFLIAAVLIASVCAEPESEAKADAKPWLAYSNYGYAGYPYAAGYAAYPYAGVYGAGYNGYATGYHYLGKRSAYSTPYTTYGAAHLIGKREAEADSEAKPWLAYSNYGYAAYPSVYRHAAYAAPAYTTYGAAHLIGKRSADSEPESWYGAYGYASPYTYGGYGSYGYSAYRPYTYGRVYGAYNGYY